MSMSPAINRAANAAVESMATITSFTAQDRRLRTVPASGERRIGWVVSETRATTNLGLAEHQRDAPKQLGIRFNPSGFSVPQNIGCDGSDVTDDGHYIPSEGGYLCANNMVD